MFIEQSNIFNAIYEKFKFIFVIFLILNNIFIINLLLSENLDNSLIIILVNDLIKCVMKWIPIHSFFCLFIFITIQ